MGKGSFTEWLTKPLNRAKIEVDKAVYTAASSTPTNLTHTTTMAFGTGNRSFGPNAKLYSFKIKTKDLPVPIFEVSKKGADGQYAVLPAPDGTASRVSGNLISASPRENTHDKKVIRSINLTLQDGDDVYFLSVGETFIGRNLYNALLGLKTFEDLEIGLYQSKPKPGQTKTFASVSLRQHNIPVRGPYDQKKDMPQVKKLVLNGAPVSDTTDLDNWFREKMTAWCKVVNAAAPKPASAPASTSTAADTPSEPAGDSEHHVSEEDTGEPPF